MKSTSLYQVVFAVVGVDEQQTELVRAGSFAEAVAVIRDFLSEAYDRWAEPLWIVVQLLREPERVGIVYAPDGVQQAFLLESGRFAPVDEIPS